MRQYFLKISEEEISILLDLLDFEINQLDQEIEDTKDDEEKDLLFMLREKVEAIANKIDPAIEQNELQDIQ